MNLLPAIKNIEVTIMSRSRSVRGGVGIVAALCAIAACTASFRNTDSVPMASNLSEYSLPAPSETITIFFFREVNYAGGGRIHTLKVDDHQIGELTDDNYYRIEVWPGEYQFTVFLPAEYFFGQTSPPISISDRVRFNPADAGHIIVYQFTDGMGNRGFARKIVREPEAFIHNRIMAASISARDTAQVKMFLGTRYDGPAFNGQPHGKGTLTWPDGSVYRGVFEYGVPTNKAKFFFSDSKIFMGIFYKGRPKSPGILLSSNGDILFAGDFIKEEPHGLGLRQGDETAEFCLYDHGRDITKTFGQLAKEIVDAEDQAAIETFCRRRDRIRARIEEASGRLALMRREGIEVGGQGKKETAEIENDLRHLEQAREKLTNTSESDLRRFVAELFDTRYERESNKFAELRKDHQTKIKAEQIWCQEESALGRNICSCAPLATDFENWPECVAPIGK